jgi:hypothetical protein
LTFFVGIDEKFIPRLSEGVLSAKKKLLNRGFFYSFM